MDDRIDVLGGEFGRRVDVGEPGDRRRRVLHRGGNARRHHAEVALRDVLQADFRALAGQQAAQFELFGRAGIRRAEFAGLRVELGVADEPVQQRVHAFLYRNFMRE